MRPGAGAGVRIGMRTLLTVMGLPLLTLACAAVRADGAPGPSQPQAGAGASATGATNPRPGPGATRPNSATPLLPLAVLDVFELTWTDKHDDEPADTVRRFSTQAESFDECVNTSTGAGPPLPDEPLARTIARGLCVMRTRGGCSRGLGMVRGMLPTLGPGPARDAVERRLVALEWRTCRVDEGSVTDRVRRFEAQVLRNGSWFHEATIDQLAALAAEPGVREVPAEPGRARSGHAVLATALADALPLLAMTDQCDDVKRLSAAAAELAVAIPACPSP